MTCGPLRRAVAFFGVAIDAGGVSDERPPVGTVPRDAPVPRADFERALRRVFLAIDSVRDDVIQLAGQVVATGEVLEREDAIEAATPPAIEQIRIADERSQSRLQLGDPEPKRQAKTAGPDCLSLLPICKGRCCQFHFALSSEDLDEGVIRWDYGKPYMIRQRMDDNYCVHSDPEAHCCTVYDARPRPCRVYDCREDARIWDDFEQRIPAGASPFARKESAPGAPPPDLAERARARQVTLAMESFALASNEAERVLVEAAALSELRARDESK
jgi:Fe-S-cluster containining protein